MTIILSDNFPELWKWVGFSSHILGIGGSLFTSYVWGQSCESVTSPNLSPYDSTRIGTKVLYHVCHNHLGSSISQPPYVVYVTTTMDHVLDNHLGLCMSQLPWAVYITTILECVCHNCHGPVYAIPYWSMHSRLFSWAAKCIRELKLLQVCHKLFHHN